MFQNGQKDAHFFQFLMKKLLYCSYFVNKTPILSKTLFSCLFFVKKHQFSKTHVALISFFSHLSWKTPTVVPIVVKKKRQFCQNYNNIMGQKPQYDAIFSLFFKKITAALMPIFCKKTSIL